MKQRKGPARPEGDTAAEGMRAALVRLGLVAEDEHVVLTPLTGGIASDIWRVDAGTRTLCIKKALHQLKVNVEWVVPVERNLYEWEYCRVAEQASPGLTPRLLCQDRDAYLFAMEYLDPAFYPLWKTQLSRGIADATFARSVGASLARVHSYSAAHPSLEALFPSDAIFYASRMESYLEATARVHADLAARLSALIDVVMTTKHALVHGDVSPKNILHGPAGPVLLDAECAFYGDPAFDVAFCLNHLLLKCLWNRPAREGFIRCFKAFTDAYLSGVDWELPDQVEARAARLLPGLFLARIDGKSPVEYVTQEEDKNEVRFFARTLILAPVERLAWIADRWSDRLATSERPLPQR